MMGNKIPGNFFFLANYPQNYPCYLFLSWAFGSVGCLGLNGPLRQYFSLYRAVSRREGERKERL